MIWLHSLLADAEDLLNMENGFLLKKISCFLMKRLEIIILVYVVYSRISSVQGKYLHM